MRLCIVLLLVVLVQPGQRRAGIGVSSCRCCRLCCSSSLSLVRDGKKVGAGACGRQRGLRDAALSSLGIVAHQRHLRSQLVLLLLELGAVFLDRGQLVPHFLGFRHGVKRGVWNWAVDLMCATLLGQC